MKLSKGLSKMMRLQNLEMHQFLLQRFCVKTFESDLHVSEGEGGSAVLRFFTTSHAFFSSFLICQFFLSVLLQAST